MAGKFDNKKHVETLIEVEGIICYAQVLSDGLQPIGSVIGEKRYADMVSGAFGLMVCALGRACDLLEGAEQDFMRAHGVEQGELFDECPSDQKRASR